MGNHSTTTRDRNPRSEDHDGVSVVIPTCNRGTYLREAVESALGQTVDILEVIIVDDGSEVDPGLQLADLGDKVKVHKLSERGGANVARNHGIEVARGAWIALLDDDDVWQPDKTARQLQAIAAAHGTDTDEDGEDGIAACICIAQDMGGPPDEPRHIDDISERLRVENPCGTSGLIARRSLLRTEPFDIAIARGQDWDLFVRLAQRDAIILLEEPLYLRRLGHDRITTRAMHQTPKELFDRACAATHKHREWLGEPAYKRRLAIIMLSYISQRKRKLHYIISAIRHSGLGATLGVLASKLR